MQDRRVKILFVSIIILMGVDAAFNHAAVTRSAFQIVRHSVTGTGAAVSDSVFSH